MLFKILETKIQEKLGPFSIGDVGNSHVKSDHSIYQVKFLLHNGKDATFSGICLDEITVSHMSCKDV